MYAFMYGSDERLIVRIHSYIPVTSDLFMLSVAVG